MPRLNVVLLESQTQFDVWLDDNHGLHDASVTAITPLPGGASLPETVTVTFRFQIAGGYAAGDERTIRTITLTAHGIREFALDPYGWHPNNCAEGIDLLDVADGVGFEIDVPAPFQLAADRFEIVSSSDTTERVPEWLSNTEFNVVSSSKVPPTPSEWLACFQSAGHNVTWRYYAGDERSPSQVPQDAYSGWFIQFHDRLTDATGGLLFDWCSIRDDGYSINIRLDDLACRELWIIAGRFLSELPSTTIRCGNATLSANVFQSHLEATRNGGASGT